MAAGQVGILQSDFYGFFKFHILNVYYKVDSFFFFLGCLSYGKANSLMKLHYLVLILIVLIVIQHTNWILFLVLGSMQISEST